MKTISAISMIVLASCLSGSILAKENEKEKELVIGPEAQVSVQSIYSKQVEQYAKDFTFDWTDYNSIAANQAHLNNIETLLQNMKTYSYLTPPQQEMLGKMLYRLGTYYTHVSRQPDSAITRLASAEALLKDKIDKAWNNNHLAYAYEQKYALTHQAEDKKQALDYSNKVLAAFPKTQNKAVVFAYFVQGLLDYDSKDYGLAETSFKTALTMSDHLKMNKDDQYARAKNRLATVILEQNNRDQEALTLLTEVNKYWHGQKNYLESPYAARNFISLGQAYLKLNKPFDARNQFDEAIKIYEHVYGKNSTLLSQPYQLLSEAYVRIGDRKQASFNAQKAKQLINHA